MSDSVSKKDSQPPDSLSEDYTPGFPDAGGTRTITTVNADFSVPYPPPGFVKGYEDVYPGAARLVFEYARLEQQNRHKMDQREQDRADAVEKRRGEDAQARRRLNHARLVQKTKVTCRGQSFAFLFAIINIAASLILFLHGGVPGIVVGTIFGGVNTLAIIASFLNPTPASAPVRRQNTKPPS